LGTVNKQNAGFGRAKSNGGQKRREGYKKLFIFDL
jgi:hypothetical protein